MAGVTVKQYSLLDFTVSVIIKEAPGVDAGLEVDIPIGGAGKYLGSITVTKSTDNVTKTVDATGAGVFSFSNDHSGTVDVEISQVSDVVANIIDKIINNYYQDYEQQGVETDWKRTVLDIVISKGSQKVVEATDCMLVKMPDLSIGNEVATRTFSFIAMEIRETGFTY